MRFCIVFVMAVIASVVPVNGVAQVEWLETEYDYGAIREDDGPAKGFARFVNRGDSATFVSRVRPSCGCTGASYPHRMIEPGDTAVISFTYNPAGRPGRFDKTVKVWTGAENTLATIRILGNVIASDETVCQRFPIAAGNLRLETDRLVFGKIKKGLRRHLFLTVANRGTEPVRPVWDNPCQAIDINSVPKEIAPGEVGTFSFYLNTSKMPVGPDTIRLTLYPGPERKEGTEVLVAVDITES